MSRGQTSFLLALIITVIVLLLSLGIFIVIREMTTRTQDDAACAAQIYASSAAVRASKELQVPPIKCPTRLVSLKTNDQDEARKELAQQMKHCWDQWGKGELPLFGEKEGMYCHVCSMVTIEGVDAVSGLPEYLDTHDAIPDVDYTVYLAGKKSGTYFKDAQFKNVTSSVLPADKPVGVIFYYAKGRYAYQTLLAKTIGNPGASAATGAFIGVGLAVTAQVSIPITFMAGTVGGVGGGLTSFAARPDSSYMTIVVVRPLSEADVKDIGCQYAPVGN